MTALDQLFDHHLQIIQQLTDVIDTLGIIRGALKPDLLPLKAPGSEDITDPIAYCDLTMSGNLIVTVRNQGFVTAGTSTTRVTFSTPSSMPASALASSCRSRQSGRGRSSS